MHAARQAERASALHNKAAGALQIRQAQGLPAQQHHEPAALLLRPEEAAHAQEGHGATAWTAGQAPGWPVQQGHDPAALLSRQIEAAHLQQGHVPSAWPLEDAQEVVAQQKQDPGALVPGQPQLAAAQQGQQHIALPSGQVELAKQSEEPGALLSRQAEVARQREVQRRSRATHMQSLQAQCVRQLHAAGEERPQRWGADWCSRAAHSGGMCMLRAMRLTGLPQLLWDVGMQADARRAVLGSTLPAALG